MSTLEISESRYSPEKTLLLTRYSEAIGGRADITLYNSTSSASPAPLVVLLHGVYGSHWAWMYSGGVHQVFQELREKNKLTDFVLVMPSDGLQGQGTGYVKHREADFESWIMEDVIAAVQSALPQVTEDSSIYLCGLSMGGYGALRLGTKYASRISGISAHSSVTRYEDLSLFIDIQAGDPEIVAQNDNCILHWVEANRDILPPIRFDCGLEDQLLRHNRELQQNFEDLGVAHEYEEHPGGHDWDYWHRQVSSSLQFFHSIENQNSS